MKKDKKKQKEEEDAGQEEDRVKGGGGGVTWRRKTYLRNAYLVLTLYQVPFQMLYKH